jgi:RNA polymerase sigma-70 factor (ECF subfamily)
LLVAIGVPSNARGTEDVAEAFRLYGGEILGYLTGFLHDAEMAQDVRQDTFLALVVVADRQEMPTVVRAWLYRVATNFAISRLRRAATAKRGQIVLAGDRTQGSIELDAARREELGQIVSALDGLAPEARLAMVLGAAGFSCREVAATIHRSESATRTLVCRSRSRVRRRLTAPARATRSNLAPVVAGGSL